MYMYVARVDGMQVIDSSLGERHPRWVDRVAIGKVIEHHAVDAVTPAPFRMSQQSATVHHAKVQAPLLSAYAFRPGR